MNLVMLLAGILVGFLLGCMTMIILGLCANLHSNKGKKTNVRDLYPKEDKNTGG